MRTGRRRMRAMQRDFTMGVLVLAGLYWLVVMATVLVASL